MVLRVIMLVFLLAASHSVQVQAESKDSAATLIVKSSPDAKFQSMARLPLSIAKAILQGKKWVTEDVPELPVAFIEWRHHQGKEVYVVSYSYNVFQMDQKVKIVLTDRAKKKLQKAIEALNKRHFGLPVPWQEARMLMPRKAFADVVDIETGLQFRVQRRAGSQHADVQPVTAADTRMMKQVYNGKWSWNRRAVLIRTDEGHVLAASMHGMPHGAGAIRDNQFPGHFCIHFKNSTTHRRKVPNPGHDLMISKASGELPARIADGTPQELISLLITAINEQDESVIKMLLNQENAPAVQRLLSSIKKVQAIKLDALSDGWRFEGPFVLDIPVQVNILCEGVREGRLTIPFRLTRGSLLERWKIEPQSIVDKFL